MHPDTELIAFLKEELAAPDRARVARHLEDCAECRETAAAFRELFAELASTTPDPPEMLWGHYEAELRAKLRERERRWGILPATRSWRPTATRSRRPATTWSGRSAATWSWSPALRIALAASAAGIILVFALDAGDRARIHAPDPIALEQTVIGSQLDLLQNYDLVERLDLLEDLDVIRQLDRDG